MRLLRLIRERPITEDDVFCWRPLFHLKLLANIASAFRPRCGDLVSSKYRALALGLVKRRPTMRLFSIEAKEHFNRGSRALWLLVFPSRYVGSSHRAAISFDQSALLKNRAKKRPEQLKAHRPSLSDFTLQVVCVGRNSDGFLSLPFSAGTLIRSTQ